jgi:hypothetical protein
LKKRNGDQGDKKTDKSGALKLSAWIGLISFIVFLSFLITVTPFGHLLHAHLVGLFLFCRAGVT